MSIKLEQVRIPEELPIAHYADELVDAIRDHQVVVVAGETGSGKSTQLPKLCLRAGRGMAGLIGHTQPRRVAARSVADRIATELGVALGSEVGFSVRFTDQVNADTQIRVMTDGILLAELSRDPDLSRYDTIIVDEAHERSLNIDFILGYLRQLLHRRPELHLIVTSATIDTDRFSEHFADHNGNAAPVFTVEGRAYPVELRYRPVADDTDQVEAIIDGVTELTKEVDGDILVFLSGEREIHDTADALRQLELPRTEILPLYARLSAAEQQRVFASHPGRRIVLATNVAETSITVPGVRAVIDTGTARISRYSRRLKVQRLPIEKISQASAAQRSGRCGRVAPGVCIRLWDEGDHAERPEFTEPEILRTNLASVILQMTDLRLGDVSDFPFIEPPESSMVRDGYRLLNELGALTEGDDGEYRLTPIGKKLARLPIDPRSARMILAAERHGCVREVLVIAAALSIQDVRERPREQRERADELHRRFTVPGSDLMSIVALWDYVKEQQKTLSGNAFRRMCRDEYLNWLRVREWRDLYSQLRQVAGQIGIRPGTDVGHPDRVHQAVLSGLLSNIGRRDDRRPPRDRRTRVEYQGARGARFEVVPGSAIGRTGSEWVVAAEVVETDRLRARRVSAIQPEWIEPIAGDLITRSYGEPEWNATSGRAVIPERVSLYGLAIVEGRRIALSAVDKVAARHMFIENALIAGDVDQRWRRRQRFISRNRARLEEWEQLGERSRRGSPGGVDDLRRLYNDVLPANITSTRHFDRWWRDQRSTTPHLLDLPESEVATLLDTGSPEVWVDRDGAEYMLTYRHDVESPFDGVTLHLPLVSVNQFSGVNLDWHVPSRRRDLAEALFRSLPKDVRRRLIPAADTLSAAMNAIGEPDGRPFTEALAAALTEVSGVNVVDHQFDLGRLSPDLIIHIVVSDADGEVYAFGDDLATIRDIVRPQARQMLASSAPIDERSGITEWDLGTLPDVLEWTDGNETLRAYPTLLDRGDSVSLRVVTDHVLAERLLHEGVRRLLLLAASPARGPVRRMIDNDRQLGLSLVGLGVEVFLDDAITAIADRVIQQHGISRSLPEFEVLCQAMRTKSPMELIDLVNQGLAIVDIARQVVEMLERLRAPGAVSIRTDAHDHLDRLVGPGMLAKVGMERVDDLERWVNGIRYRLQHLAGRVERDLAGMREVAPVERRFAERLAEYPNGSEPDTLQELGFMIEELRVAVFAQELGVAQQVSAVRLLRQLG